MVHSRGQGTTTLRSDSALALVAPRWEAQPWYWRGMAGCAAVIHLPREKGQFRHATNPLLPRKRDWDVVVFLFEPLAAAERRPCDLIT